MPNVLVPIQLLDPQEGTRQQQQQQHETIQELLRESTSLREELHNLGCLRQIKAEERAKKHRELLLTQVFFSRPRDNEGGGERFKIGFDVAISASL